MLGRCEDAFRADRRVPRAQPLEDVQVTERGRLPRYWLAIKRAMFLEPLHQLEVARGRRVDGHVLVPRDLLLARPHERPEVSAPCDLLGEALVPREGASHFHREAQGLVRRRNLGHGRDRALGARIAQRAAHQFEHVLEWYVVVRLAQQVKREEE